MRSVSSETGLCSSLLLFDELCLDDDRLGPSTVTVTVSVVVSGGAGLAEMVRVAVHCVFVTVDLITVIVGPLTKDVLALAVTVPTTGHTETLIVDWKQAGHGGQLTNEQGIW